jgi:hypothetical protein
MAEGDAPIAVAVIGVVEAGTRWPGALDDDVAPHAGTTRTAAMASALFIWPIPAAHSPSGDP